MHKWTMFVLFIAASILGLLVFVLQAPEGADHAAPPAEDEIRITATNFEFDKPEYRVKVGETKTVSLVNLTGQHGVEIVGLDVKLENDQLSQEVIFDKPGEYDVVCSILCGPGHLEMVSKLIVEE